MPTTTEAQNVPMSIVPGVCPPTDSTKSNTRHFTMADKIRFLKGMPQKLGGWTKAIMNGAIIVGCIRAIFSANLNEKIQTVLGGSKALYALTGSDLANITPFQTGTIAIANSLSTHRATLANNPISTTNLSNEVIIADTEAAKFVAGDNYTLSGAAATGGVSAVNLNKTHIVRAVLPNAIMIKAAANATSTVTGGGAAVVRSSGLVTIDAAAHGQNDGARVKIAGAAAFGGITAPQINTQFQIRNVATNTFDVMTDGLASAQVTAAGGAATVYQQQIVEGLCDETAGQGYGMGKYGMGRYGTALVSATGRRFPRIWFLDVFGENIIAAPGNGGGVYSWNGDQTTAPELIAGAPTVLNYAFVSDNILVTLGADGSRNKIKASDIGSITTWTASSTNQVFEDFIEGAGRLWSHVSLNGTNLLFTPTQCYTFRYIGLPFVWEIKFKDNIGLISPMARVVVKGVAYWMGQNNFYRWRGGNVEVVPSNSSSETTLLRYIFQNLNRGQASKCFAWYNERFDEIWFHYPSQGSQEVDRVARFHVTEQHWTPDTFDRLAAEYPNVNLQFPRLISSEGVLYRHEVGVDDDVNPMPFSVATNYRDFGTDNVLNSSVVPDSVQTGDITVQIDGYSYPQSAVPKASKIVTVEPSTPYIPVDVDARFLQYTISGNALGQDWIMGKWLEPVQPASVSE